MKELIVALTLAASAVSADPVEGVWQTEPDDGAFAHVTMQPCGQAICGVITRTYNTDGEYASLNLGKTLVIGMVPKGAGKYEGKVWRPSNGKTYIGKMDHTGETLALRGCVAGGLLCSKQTWRRIK
ncbi:DUF2147 domain-containing protein [Poseidonocella pacifica]|nr:DUF2147 domain-containing protein [Poseidonocella pacifica]